MPPPISWVRTSSGPSRDGHGNVLTAYGDHGLLLWWGATASAARPTRRGSSTSSSRSSATRTMRRLLLAVRRRVALALGRPQLAADVVVVQVLGQDRRHPPAHERARAHVARLLLDPHHALEVRVALHQLAQLVLGERVEHLHPRDRDVVGRRRAPRGRRCRSRPCPSTARAWSPSRRSAQRRRRRSRAGTRRSASSSIVEVAAGRRSRLLGVITTSGRGLETSAWRRSRWKYCAGVVHVGHADVALGAGLEEALDAAGGVLGARALVAVGQQQRQARGLPPLGQAGGEELVEDHLRGVHEVAELRLPQHQRVGVLHAVAVLEARGSPARTAGCCAARTATPRCAGSAAGSRRSPVSASWSTRWRWLNVPRSVSWPVRRIGTPSASSEANASDSACAQSTVPSALGGLAALLEERLELAVHVEAVGHLHDLLVERAQQVLRQRGLRLAAHRAVELVLAGVGRARRSSP